MWNFKKLVLFASLVLSACVPNALADALIDAKINHAVHTAFHGKQVNIGTVRPILKDLMPKVSGIIEHKIDGEYKNLHEALKELNIDEPNLLVVRVQLQKVVNHLPEKSKKYIKAKFPLLG